MSKDGSHAAMVAMNIEMNYVGDHVNLAAIQDTIHEIGLTNDETPNSRFDVEFIRS